MKTAVAVVVTAFGVLLAPAASAQTVPRPPDAFLASATGEVKADIQAYCWSEPDGSGGFIGVCADNFMPIDPVQTLAVEQGGLLTLRFDRPIQPRSVTVRRGQSSTAPPVETLAVPAGNPTQFRADFPPGTHIITVVTTWEQGDALYVFEVTVRPAFVGPGVLTPEFLGAVERLLEAARGFGGGGGSFGQDLAGVLASMDALIGAAEELVDGIVGGQVGFGAAMSA